MLQDEARESLAALTWHRNFLTNATAVRSAHQDQFESFKNLLPEAVTEQENQLHPDQRFVIAGDRRSVAITEHATSLATCHANWATAGTLRLQFFDGNGTEMPGDELHLDCYGENEYVWDDVATGLTVDARELPAFVVRRLLDTAIEIVQRQTESATAAPQYAV